MVTASSRWLVETNEWLNGWKMATANPAFSSSKLTIETIDTLITETLEKESLEQGVK